VITNERIVAYLNSLDRGNADFLNKIEEEARRTNIPIIRRETQNLLKLLLEMQKPQKILEVGTAIGFSALFMLEYAPVGCRITTIEKYEKRIPIAKNNFHASGKEENILFLEGDAADILEGLLEKRNEQNKETGFDFIFMDAAKGQYLNFFPYVLTLLNQGGLLISDNVLQDGDIIESRFAITRRNRTIHSRMRDYLYTLMNEKLLTTSVLPVGDGVTISVKK